METSSAGAFDAKQHVTTFIPQQVLFPGSDDVGMHGNEDDGVGLLPLHPFLRASLSRRRFLLRLLKSWEGRDALFVSRYSGNEERCKVQANCALATFTIHDTFNLCTCPRSTF